MREISIAMLLQIQSDIHCIGRVLGVKEVDLAKLRKGNNYSNNMMSFVLTFILSCDQQYMTCVPMTVVEEKKVLK